MMTPRPDTSVVVCTRNRSGSLRNACESIFDLDFPPERWELVIVDNRSSDDTLAVARAVRDRRPEKVRVIEEPEVGLSAARNAGIRAARGEHIAFIDDDAFPEPLWLAHLVEALGQPGVLAAGGPVEPRFEGDLPSWLDDRYLPYLTVWDKGPEPLRLAYNEYPRGANIAFHRSAFERFGTFSPHLGRKGRSLISCEEIELCLRIERAGGAILYIPGARVAHHTVAGRITRDWLARRFAAQGASEAIVDWRHAGWRGLKVGWQRYTEMARSARSTSRREASPANAFHARCLSRARRGYLRSLLRAPIVVPRYRAPRGAPPLAPWLPFVATKLLPVAERADVAQ